MHAPSPPHRCKHQELPLDIQWPRGALSHAWLSPFTESSMEGVVLHHPMHLCALEGVCCPRVAAIQKCPAGESLSSQARQILRRDHQSVLCRPITLDRCWLWHTIKSSNSSLIKSLNLSACSCSSIQSKGGGEIRRCWVSYMGERLYLPACCGQLWLKNLHQHSACKARMHLSSFSNFLSHSTIPSCQASKVGQMEVLNHHHPYSLAGDLHSIVCIGR